MEKLRNCRLFVEKLLSKQYGNKSASRQSSILKSAPSEFSGDALIWVKSDPKYVSAVRAVLSAVCAETALSGQDQEDLKLAVGEAVCNAIEHGSPCGGEDHVCVTFAVDRGAVIVRVSDNGGPFVRKCGRRRLKMPRDRGYGLHLIKSLVTGVRIQSGLGGTTVTLEKRYRVPMKAAS